MLKPARERNGRAVDEARPSCGSPRRSAIAAGAWLKVNALVEESSMAQDVKKRDPFPETTRRVARLFRVLVLGGAVIAAACATVPAGDTGSPDGGQGDGGVQGW